MKSLGADEEGPCQDDAGLHTGECEIIGDDVGGIAVHIGARVAALAAAGEVLVSSTMKDLVVGSTLRFSEIRRWQNRGLTLPPGSAWGKP
jgi:class 3 adenylate cyclase